jgi:hypothetical protein
MTCGRNPLFSGRMLLGALGLVILAACSNRSPEPPRKSEAAAANDQNSPSDQRVPTSQQSKASAAEPAGKSRDGSTPTARAQTTPKQSSAQPNEPSSPQEVQPPPPAAGPIAASEDVKTAPKDVAFLKASIGTVRFEHKKHSGERKLACETCHHSSRPEHVALVPQEACGTCHTSIPTPPMKTKLQAAFHNPTATAGTCIDCHKAENTTGKAAPVKCLECHKKEAA